MSFLGFANALAILACAWAVWVRRLSFGSRWDAPLTVGVALYGVASALDTPWRLIAAASEPLTSKYYLLNTVGHICLLAGTAAGLQSVFVRLLPDGELHRLMRARVTPLVGLAAAVMIVCVVASPATSVMSADWLYGVPLDGWLRVYFPAFFLSMTALLWMAVFGGSRLREEPNSGAALPLIGTASTGSLACLGVLAAILTGRTGSVAAVWSVAFLATTVAALVCAFFWRRRIAALRTAPDGP